MGTRGNVSEIMGSNIMEKEKLFCNGLSQVMVYWFTTLNLQANIETPSGNIS
jgi:hypothetical protein